MLWFYRLFFLPALVILAPYYLWRMRRRGGYRQKLWQRFGGRHGLPVRQSGVRRIWIQAVSVGEVLAIGPLLEKLVRAGDVEVYLTTTTSTGRRMADDHYRGILLGVGYFPVDWWPFCYSAWAQIEPDLVILTEGERWPEHIHQASARGVPVIAINARLSDRSFRRLRWLRFVTKLTTHGIARLLPCSGHDEARFRELGFPAEKIFTTGNIKLDLTISPLGDSERTALRRELGLGDGLVLLGSSTWPGEESALIDAWRATRARGIQGSLLIVPRHAERRPEIERTMRDARVSYHLRSHGAAPGAVDVSIADTTGELRKLTQLADLVFIGKSLPPNEGGQTPVEAAALRKPLIFGPRMNNFRTIASELVRDGAAITIADARALATEVAALLGDSARRDAMAAAAAKWHRENAGAVERTLMVIREELAKLR